MIAVSATLGGAPPFTALAIQMGLDANAQPGAWGDRDEEGRWTSDAGRGYVALQTASSFDWRNQGILYVAKDLPDPSRARDAWVDEAGARICDLVNAAGGRALVLCTSHANVKRFAEVLRERTDHDILEQGEREAGRLIEAFVDDEASVLVGTRSFWAGIDAAGAACVLVVIDRIPFPAPDEPLHAARRTRAEQRGVDAFAAVDLPVAALVLAQGAGRLLRRPTDRGVVAVLDPRLARPGVPQATPRRDAAVPAQRRPRRRVRAVGGACRAARPRPLPGRRPSASPADVDPRDLRTDLSSAESVVIRNLVACDGVRRRGHGALPRRQRHLRVPARRPGARRHGVSPRGRIATAGVRGMSSDCSGPHGGETRRMASC